MNNIALSWVGWLHANWTQLAAGAKLQAPAHLPHPRYAGFARESLASPEGQVVDWVLPVTDGSRIHVHECSDGRLVAHRDQYDPNRSAGHLLAHLVLETALVPVTLLILGVIFATRSAGGRA